MAPRHARLLPWLALGSASLLGACAASAPAPSAPTPPSGTAPLATITVAPIVVTAWGPAELAAEFERGRSLLLVDRFHDAATLFDRLRLLAKGTELAAPSLYNAALTYEGMGELPRALDRYRELAAQYPQAAITPSGLVRLGRLLGYLERWEELVATASQLLEHERELPVMDLIEALGAKALGLVEQRRIEEAEPLVRRAQDLVEEHRFGEAGTPPPQLAQVSFAFGEIRRLRSEQIRLVPVPADFADALERRCQGLLEAQSAYSDAMRSRDAHWSAMSGYRVGQLYQDLHAETMRIPAPTTAATQRQKDLFEAAMRLRYRILLEKGLKMMDATVRMGERTGEASPWIGRAREAKGELERALEEEKATLARMPFTEDEVRAALEKLKGKSDAGKPTQPANAREPSAAGGPGKAT